MFTLGLQVWRMSRTLPVLSVLSAASIIGGIVGAGSIVTTLDGRTATAAAASDISATANDIAVASGIKRLRTPRPGDRWGGFNDARAAGSAPIYRGEPGYREDMDGDGDGIACEDPR